MIDEDAIRARYAAVKDRLDERGRRLFVAAEKAVAGYGGTAAVCRATGSYPKAIRVTDDEMATLNIVTDTWHPEWNYTISPRPSK